MVDDIKNNIIIDLRPLNYQKKPFDIYIMNKRNV